LLPWLRPDCKT
jgi:S-adenosylmethionine synthetase